MHDDHVTFTAPTLMWVKVTQFKFLYDFMHFYYGCD